MLSTKKIILNFLSLTLLILIFNKTIFSGVCDGMTKVQCEQKTNELGKQRDTLEGEIQYISSQIELTNLRIQDTEKKISTTQKEIDILGSRIEGLDDSLTNLSATLIKKVVKDYKQRSVSLFGLLFDSQSAGELFSKIKYIKTARDNNQKLLVQVQEAKSNFEEQKKLRDEKKIELDALQETLNNQQVNLQNQQKAKQTLYSITAAQYQSARQELLAMTSFARNATEQGLKSFGSGSNGWYYTQRDPQWGNLTLGASPYSVWEAGCAITSVAMVCKSYGQGISPASIASDYSNFSYGDLLNNRFNCSGKTADWISTPSQDQVKLYVNSGTPVILRLVAPSVSGLHFIVAWKWDGSDFIIHDPYYGPDIKFSERYAWSQITTAIAIH